MLQGEFNNLFQHANIVYSQLFGAFFRCCCCSVRYSASLSLSTNLSIILRPQRLLSPSPHQLVSQFHNAFALLFCVLKCNFLRLNCFKFCLQDDRYKFLFAIMYQSMVACTLYRILMVQTKCPLSIMNQPLYCNLTEQQRKKINTKIIFSIFFSLHMKIHRRDASALARVISGY